MTWNGAAWTPTSITGPGSGGVLNSVSCGSGSFCAAAGSYDTGNEQLPLFEEWTSFGASPAP